MQSPIDCSSAFSSLQIDRSDFNVHLKRFQAYKPIGPILMYILSENQQPENNNCGNSIDLS